MRLAPSILGQRGDANIIVMAVALPVLLLLISAATDVARIPIIKQQIEGAAHAAFDAAILDEAVQAGGTFSDPLAARNWCDWIAVDHPCYDCDACGGGDCTGSKDDQLSSDGSNPLNAVTASVIEQLSSSVVPMLAHAQADMTVKAGVFNIVVNGAGVPTSVETVRLSTANEGALAYPIDLASYATNTLLPAAGSAIGYWTFSDAASGGPNYTHMGVMIIGAAVRTRHFFNFPTGLRFGETPVEGGAPKSDETTIVTTIVRPLARNVRPSGPAINMMGVAPIPE